jgi:hypothetical protein
MLLTPLTILQVDGRIKAANHESLCHSEVYSSKDAARHAIQDQPRRSHPTIVRGLYCTSYVIRRPTCSWTPSARSISSYARSASPRSFSNVASCL